MENINLRVFISKTFNPWFNLAIEDWIFNDLEANQHVLYLWRNSDTVVIGRFQNPWVECNVEKMEEDKVFLARRQSGGGAVYHDLGNTNFTFLSSKKNFDKSKNNQIILNALSDLGIIAKASGRNDIVMDMGEEDFRKISGSAFKEKKDRSFHHGTLLIDADLSKLSNYLNPDKKKLQAKGIKSVRARVANIREVSKDFTHEKFIESAVNNFFKTYNSTCEIEYIDESLGNSITNVKDYFEFMSNWSWRFGETPEFSHHFEDRFSWGAMDVHLQVEKSIITKAIIYSDSLHPEMIEMISDQLETAAYNKTEIAKALDLVSVELPMISDYLEEFKGWMLTQVK